MLPTSESATPIALEASHTDLKLSIDSTTLGSATIESISHITLLGFPHECDTLRGANLVSVVQCYDAFIE